ncbi:hypothetical protein JW756_05145 [Candidatus Woesearchaeota archaeon]|nr:hypothetical protein [Candidatus Woesearchaeota archaeon]
MKVNITDLEKELAQRKRALEIKQLAKDAMQSMRTGAPQRKEAQVLMGYMFMAKKDFGSAIYYIGRALEQAQYNTEKIIQPEFVKERALTGIERIIEQVKKPETRIDAGEKYQLLKTAGGEKMNKYESLEEAANLVSKNLGSDVPLNMIRKIVSLAPLMNEADIEKFIRLASMTDSFEREYLINSSLDMAKVAGPDGLLAAAEVKDQFGWATATLYKSAPGIFKRWSIPEFKVIVDLGKKIKNLDEQFGRDILDSCSSFFEHCPGVRKVYDKSYLEKKVEAWIQAVRETRRWCRGCSREYFDRGNESIYYSGYCGVNSR